MVTYSCMTKLPRSLRCKPTLLLCMMLGSAIQGEYNGRCFIYIFIFSVSGAFLGCIAWLEMAGVVRVEPCSWVWLSVAFLCSSPCHVFGESMLPKMASLLMSGACAGMSERAGLPGHLPSFCIQPRHAVLMGFITAWWSHSSQTSYMTAGFPRVNILKGWGGGCTALYTTAWEVPECSFCHILLVKQVTKTSPVTR